MPTPNYFDGVQYHFDCEWDKPQRTADVLYVEEILWLNEETTETPNHNPIWPIWCGTYNEEHWSFR